MTAENLDSVNITNLDAQPIVIQSQGEGAVGNEFIQTDTVNHTTNFGSATKNSSRQCRIPVEAKIKRVWMYTTGLDSSSAQTITLDVNLSFSDSLYDETAPALQSQIPQSGLTGAITTLTSYSSPNKMFGAALTVAASGAVQFTEVTYKNLWTPALGLLPAWAAMGGSGAATAAVQTAGGGFAQQGGSGQICSPGGWFDLLIVTAHTATTNATGTIGTEIDFVI
jgi:hypothetical protein